MRLFKNYPRTDYEHPQEALATMVTVLSGYSLAIVREVTSPETGLQRTSVFPPRTAEIVTACDAVAARLARYQRFQNWGKQADAERLAAPSGPKPSLDELKARYGGSLLPEGFGIEAPKAARPSPQAPSWEKVIADYHAHPERLTHLTSEIGRRKSLRA